MKLVVTHAFGDFTPGQEITDKKEMEAVLESHASSVVRAADTPVDAEEAEAPPEDAASRS